MSEWATDTLGNLVDFQKGRKVHTSPFRLAGYDRYLGAASLGGRHDGYASTFLSVQATENDVLMLWDGERSGLVGHNLKGVVSSTVSKLSPKGRITSDLLYYFLLHNFEWIQNRRTGTGVPHVPKDLSRILKLSFPSDPNIQKKIARILSTIDEAIEQTETLIGKYEQIKAGMMHDLFTRGLTANGRLRPPREQAPELYKETPIGWIPKEWQYELLDQLADRGSGHTPNKSTPQYWNGGVKWISLADSYRLDRLYISDTDFEISTLGIQNSSAVLHPAGIVVLSRDAGVGKSAITTAPMAVSQHFMCWRCGAKMDNHYLYYWLQFKKRMFENIAMGSTILTIGLPYFKRLKISAPKALDEQKEIGKRLKGVEFYIFSLAEDLAKLQKQKSGLMHDLLTGKVPVTVDEGEVAHV
jgi:type I restriction enzyme S subunit